MNPNQPAPNAPQPPHPQQDYSQPVAYDAQGRPLYAHPPVTPQQPAAPQVSSHVTVQPQHIQGHNFDPQLRAQYANEPGVIHAVRPLDPPELPVSDEARQKHEASKKKYPFLNLSEGEFVIDEVRRHPIGLFIPVGTTVLLIVCMIALMFMYPSLTKGTGLPPVEDAILPLGLLALLFGLGGYIVVWVYLQNMFILTNESVIQEIQHSLFSKHEQTVSLGSIEDASFTQIGPLETMLDYGSIRLSTEGEETTYRFQYVANPKRQIARLNNAVEAFKNGRPVTGEE